MELNQGLTLTHSYYSNGNLTLHCVVEKKAFGVRKRSLIEKGLERAIGKYYLFMSSKEVEEERALEECEKSFATQLLGDHWATLNCTTFQRRQF